jgi:hypothetical protein
MRPALPLPKPSKAAARVFFQESLTTPLRTTAHARRQTLKYCSRSAFGLRKRETVTAFPGNHEFRPCSGFEEVKRDALRTRCTR